METLNLFGLISRLMKVNNDLVIRVAKIEPPVNNDANSILKDFLHIQDGKKAGGLAVSRQLALEQIRHLN